MGSLPPTSTRPFESHGLLPFRRTVVASTAIAAPFADVKQAARTCLTTLLTDAFPSERTRGNDLMAVMFMGRWARRLGVPVLVDVEGAYRRVPGLVAHLRWHSQRHRRLFPVMNADLLARPTSGAGSVLIVHGTYHPPFGLLGLIGDLLVGRVVARWTAQTFVEELGGALERALARGQCAVTSSSATTREAA